MEQQHPHHQSRVERRRSPTLAVVGVKRRQVQVLIDQVSNKPGQVVLREPLIQRRRDQQHLIGLERPECLVHRTQLDHRRLHRLNREQPIITLICRHTQVSQRSARYRSTPRRVFRTHAPSRAASEGAFGRSPLRLEAGTHGTHGTQHQDSLLRPLPTS